MEYYSPANPKQNRLVKHKMITNRWGRVSGLMSDGRVLTAGRLSYAKGGSLDILSSSELFHPRMIHD